VWVIQLRETCVQLWGELDDARAAKALGGERAMREVGANVFRKRLLFAKERAPGQTDRQSTPAVMLYEMIGVVCIVCA
jgi:hypothetical protein